MKVLIVEDEKRLAQALGQIMEEQKYSVDIVYDGEDGLDYALSGQYDVIVLDVMLPKKDGFTVVYELRKAKISSPVLMLTARDEINDKVTGLDCGADDYMTKPSFAEKIYPDQYAAGWNSTSGCFCGNVCQQLPKACDGQHEGHGTIF